MAHYPAPFILANGHLANNKMNPYFVGTKPLFYAEPKSGKYHHGF